MPAAASDPTQAYPTQAYAAVGAAGQAGPGTAPGAAPHNGGPAGGNNGMTWSLPVADATQAIPAQGGPAEPDPFADLYRPEGGARPNPNATQVMAPVPADFGQAEFQQQAYDQPGYDQPIDYQAQGQGPGGYAGEPYEAGYADDYPEEHGQGPRSGRGAKIGIGVAAGAILVIVISLITLGGHSSTPSAGPANTPETVTTPTGTPASTSEASAAANPPASSTPSSSASSPSQHTPGIWQLGDSGPEVKWIQTRLHQLGVYNGPINGTFDAATQAGVAAFQGRVHSADPSGVVGRSTRTALIAAGSKPTLSPQVPGLPVGGDKHHKGGANPADVKRLQQALAVALNSGLKPTGQFDVDTFSAVVQYQSAIGVMPDGVANGQVWAALQQGRITG
jgi:peptidoglycan hydrolase-like protein with peptidoglycan-binding domain